jgi:metal-responsive CopG/Arc/MetJ family transcriptional regulator
VRRGTVSKDEARLLTFWVPKGLLPLLDEGVRKLDSDRSKFIRIAIREKLAREGIRLTSEN